VVRHPALDAHAQRGDLVRANPYADGPLAAVSGDAKVGQCLRHDVLQVVHVVARAQAKTVQVHDWIAHHLAWPVVRDVTAPLGGADRDALPAEHIRRREDVGRVSAPTERNHWRVFAQYQRVGNGILLACEDEPLLQGLRLAVGHGPQRQQKARAHQSVRISA